MDPTIGLNISLVGYLVLLFLFILYVWKSVSDQISKNKKYRQSLGKTSIGQNSKSQTENNSYITSTSIVVAHSNWAIDNSFGDKILSPNSSWNILRQLVFRRDGFKCVICGENQNLSVDHIKERELGGTNDLSNLRTLCRDCHEGRHFNNFFDKPFNADDNYGENYKPKEKIALINKAINDKTSLSIKYIDRYNVRSYRVIHPKKIYKGGKFKRGIIYFEAYDDLDKANRTFRLSRMRISNNNRCEYLDKPVLSDKKWS